MKIKNKKNKYKKAASRRFSHFVVHDSWRPIFFPPPTSLYRKRTFACALEKLQGQGRAHTNPYSFSYPSSNTIKRAHLVIFTGAGAAMRSAVGVGATW